MGNQSSVHLSYDYDQSIADTLKYPNAKDSIYLHFKDYYQTIDLTITISIKKKGGHNGHKIITKFLNDLDLLESEEVLSITLQGDPTFALNYPLSFSKIKTGYLVTHVTNNLRSQLFEFETDNSLVTQLRNLFRQMIKEIPGL